MLDPKNNQTPASTVDSNSEIETDTENEEVKESSTKEPNKETTVTDDHQITEPFIKTVNFYSKSQV